MSVFCVGNELVNRIVEKTKPAYNSVWNTTELNFPTWEEAHAWIIKERREALKSSKKEVTKDAKSLAFAMCMKNPNTAIKEKA